MLPSTYDRQKTLLAQKLFLSEFETAATTLRTAQAAYNAALQA
jgi:hypothetical protein